MSVLYIVYHFEHLVVTQKTPPHLAMLPKIVKNENMKITKFANIVYINMYIPYCRCVVIYMLSMCGQLAYVRTIYTSTSKFEFNIYECTCHCISFRTSGCHTKNTTTSCNVTKNSNE